MAQPYIGEIRMFAGNFAPAGWAMCDGQLLSINEYDTLFNLIGTTYGGDGQNTFAVPDMRGRLPIHMGTGAGSQYQIGQNGGVEQVTLTTTQLPAHTHPLLGAKSSANKRNPKGALFAFPKDFLCNASAGPLNPMDSSSISQAGGSQPHTNVQPYLCINFIISLFGIYPSPT
jgi:microcystin-dependent protein